MAELIVENTNNSRGLRLTFLAAILAVICAGSLVSCGPKVYNPGYPITAATDTPKE